MRVIKAAPGYIIIPTVHEQIIYAPTKNNLLSHCTCPMMFFLSTIITNNSSLCNMHFLNYYANYIIIAKTLANHTQLTYTYIYTQCLVANYLIGGESACN